MRKLSFRPGPRLRRLALRAGGVLAVAYLSFATLVLWAMHQPPETFAKVMARMPGPVPFLLFPFESAWLHARAGHLRVGDRAPGFSLAAIDKSARIQLSELNRQQPVVLVFGSYT